MNISLDIWTIWFYGCSMVDFNLQQSGGEFHGIIEVACEVRGSFVYVFFYFFMMVYNPIGSMVLVYMLT